MISPISSPIPLVLAFALAASSFLLLRRGQGRDTSWIINYLRRPLRLRGIVGLKEIGTRHKLVPDVVLCLLLGLPGVVLFGLGHRTSLSPPFRTFVLAESVATAAVSAYADGLLHEEYLWVDQKTSVVHVLTWAGVLWRLGPQLEAGTAAALSASAAICLAVFHRRLHETYVVRDWQAARWCARLWHIGGLVVPLALVLASSS